MVCGLKDGDKWGAISDLGATRDKVAISDWGTTCPYGCDK